MTADIFSLLPFIKDAIFPLVYVFVCIKSHLPEKVVPDLFYLASGWLLGQSKSSHILWRNIVTLISVLVANTVSLWNLLSLTSIVHIALSTAVFQVPTRMEWKYSYSRQVFFSSKSAHLPPFSRSQHGQVSNRTSSLTGTNFYFSYYSNAMQRCHNQNDL